MYGAYLLAVWDTENEEYQSISKIGTGFDEAQLAAFHALLKPTVVDDAKPYYKCAVRPQGVKSFCSGSRNRMRKRASAGRLISRGHKLEPSHRSLASGATHPARASALAVQQGCRACISSLDRCPGLRMSCSVREPTHCNRNMLSGACRYGSNPKDLPEVWFEPTQVGP